MKTVFLAEFLTLCILGNCMWFCCHLLTFFQNQLFFIKKPLVRNTIRVSSGLNPHQALHVVRPDLGLNSLQRIFVASQERLKKSTDQDRHDYNLLANI